MTFCTRKKFKSLFTMVCIVVVSFMVGYWLYKYQIEDRDIGVVDYAPLEDAKEISFPALTFCFEDPFLKMNLKDVNSNITRRSYFKYLAGDFYDEIHEQIEYANVTLDLQTYIKSGIITWQNGSYEVKNSDYFNHIEVFSGFAHSLDKTRTFILKCFMVMYNGEEQRKVQEMMLIYDIMRLNADLEAVVRYLFIISSGKLL